MAENFKVTLQAELDTTKAEQQIDNLGKGKKVKIEVDTGDSSKGVQNINQSIRTAQSSTSSFGDTLKRALNIGSSVAVVAKGFQLIRTAARNARTAIKDIDAAITDLRLATGDSYANAAKMVTGYNDMGKALGSTTKEVSDSAVTWLRQGKNAEEAGVLIKDALILSKVGMLDSAEAAKYLTSSMKGYNVGVDDAIRVIDKLTAVDANAAVNAGGLAQAMSQTAVTVNMAGVSMDKLLGYLAVVGETTQKDMSSIGNSFKTIFARMNDIKAGKLSLIDDDGTTELLSDVEITLKNVGIDLRATMNEFNNSGEVLDALAAKWDNLSSVQQAALTKAFAGVRQGENFRVLMENYDAASKYMDVAANSAGTAERKFAAYLDSIEAKTKMLQASFESLAVNSVSPETYGRIIDATTSLVEFLDKTNLAKGALAGIATTGAIKGFTALAAGITNATARFQEFNTALQLLKAGNIGEAEISQLATLTANLSASQQKAVLSSRALSVEQRVAILSAQGMTSAEASAAVGAMGLATAEGAATGATVGLSGALKGLWATLMANPLVAVFMAVTAGVAIYSTYSRRVEEARQKSLDAAKAAGEQTNKIRDLYNAYNDANQAYADGTGSKEALTSATEALLSALGVEASAVSDLVAQYGDLDTAINKVTSDALRNQRLDLISGLQTAQTDLLKAANLSDGVFFSGFGANNRTLIDALRAQGFDITGTAFNQSMGLAGGRDTYKGVLALYKDIVRARDTMQKAAEEAGMSTADMMGTSVWKSLDREFTLIEEKAQTMYERMNDLNANIAQELFTRWNYDIPETTDAYFTLRDSLVAATMADADFAGSQEDATRAVEGFLSSISGVKEFVGEYNRFKSRVKSITDSTVKAFLEGAELTKDQLDEIQRFMTETGYTTQEAANYFAQMAKEMESASGASLSTDSSIGALTSLQNELQQTTADLEAYNKAMEGGEKGDAAAQYADAYSKAVEDLEAGMSDTNAIKAAAKLLFSDEQLQAWGYDLERVGKELQKPMMEAIFGGESSDYGANFANYIRDNMDIFGNAVQITDNGDGSFDFAYTSIKDLAEASGLAEGTISALLDCLDRFGVQSMMSGEEFGQLTERFHEGGDNVRSFIDDLARAGRDEFEIKSIVNSLKEAGEIGEKDLKGFDLSQYISESVAKAKEDLTSLSEESPTLDADNTPGMTKAEEFQQKLQSIVDGSPYEATLGATTEFENAESDMEQLQALTIDPKVVSYNENGSVNVEETNARLQALDIDPKLIAFTDNGSGIVAAETVANLQAAGIDPKIIAFDEQGNVDVEETINRLQALTIAEKLITFRADGAVDVESTVEALQGAGIDPKEVNFTDNGTGEGVKSIINDIAAQVYDRNLNVFADLTGLHDAEQGMRDFDGSEASSNIFLNDNVTGPLNAALSNFLATNGTAVTWSINMSGGGISGKGTSHHMGGFASGTKDAPGGPTLINELGPELVSEDGKATIYDNGNPTVVDLSPHAVVLTADETKKALSGNHLKTPIPAFSSGTGSTKATKKTSVFSSVVTAFKTGLQKLFSAATIPTKTKTAAKAGGGGGGGGGTAASSSTKGTDLQKVDWIEVSIERIESKIKSISRTADSAYKVLSTRLSATQEQISAVTDELSIQQRGYERYMQEAKSVGLSEDLAKLVRDGTIDIGKYDKDTQKLIQDYKSWFDKAQKCSDAVSQLKEDLADLYATRFDMVQKDYEDQLTAIRHQAQMLESDLDMVQTRGYLLNASAYQKMTEIQAQSITKMRSELVDLNVYFTKAVDSGQIQKNSESWHAMRQKIENVEKAIADANVQLAEYQKTIRQIQWDAFDFAQDRFSHLSKETDFLIDLMQNDKLFDDRGQFTRTADATIGLRVLNYNAYMAQADAYAQEMQKIQKELERDPFDTELIKRREALLGLQQDSIKSAEAEKEALASLVSDGISKELDALKKLIDAYEESITSSKDLFEYQKRASDQAESIAEAQKKLSAYAGDSSEENMARIQKLNKELKDAQQNLQETERDQSISEQKKLLDFILNEYEDLLNSRLDNVDALMSDMIEVTNANLGDIREEIEVASEKVGYSITEGMHSVLYGQNFSNYDKTFEDISTVNEYLDQIYRYVAAMAKASGAVKAYASGGLVKETGLAHLDGTPSRPELVLDAVDTQNFLVLRDILKNADLSALKSTPYLSALDSKESQYRALMGNAASHTEANNSSITIDVGGINIKEAQNMDDIIRQLRDSSKFERIVESIAVDPLTGKSKFRKYSVKP